MKKLVCSVVILCVALGVMASGKDMKPERGLTVSLRIKPAAPFRHDTAP